MDISKAEFLHLGWESCRTGGSKYKFITKNKIYYMWIISDIIEIKIATLKKLAVNSETIFKGTLDCPDELNTLMYQLKITKI
tara:strand:- start:325 stop:570 length:246 start_codon:yes stop_codon:yes gene_type:complete